MAVYSGATVFWLQICAHGKGKFGLVWVLNKGKDHSHCGEDYVRDIERYV